MILDNQVLELSSIDKIEIQVLRARDEKRHYWATFGISKDLKNEILDRFSDKEKYLVESKICPKKLYDVIIEILYVQEV